MPRRSLIASLLGRSPFPAVQEHMREVLATVRHVPALFEAVCAGEQERVEEIKTLIFEAEQRADDVKNALRSHLPKSLFMPVDRRDLLSILDMQDSIADTAQDIAGILVERPMAVPEPLAEPLVALCARCVDVCEIAMKLIENLDELVSAGFEGRRAEKVNNLLDELSRVESETDELGLSLARLLFAHEDEMKPVSVMIWYRIIEWIGDLADYAEKVGNRLRLLIAR